MIVKRDFEVASECSRLVVYCANYEVPTVMASVAHMIWE
jgi:hypothetical protein